MEYMFKYENLDFTAVSLSSENLFIYDEKRTTQKYRRRISGCINNRYLRHHPVHHPWQRWTRKMSDNQTVLLSTTVEQEMPKHDEKSVTSIAVPTEADKIEVFPSQPTKDNHVTKEVNATHVTTVRGPELSAITVQDIEVAIKATHRTKGLKGKARTLVRQACDQCDPATLQKQLIEGKYNPSPYKTVTIQGNGKTRTLGLPSPSDRIVQTLITQQLTPYCEKYLFHDEAYAFRPGRSTGSVAEQILADIKQGYLYALKIDIKGFFDAIDHELLLHILRHRLGLGEGILSLINSIVKAGKINQGRWEPTEKGLPQGGVISPLLSNVYGTMIDERLIQAGARFVRYADDILILSKIESELRHLATLVDPILAEYRLERNIQKTQLAPITSMSFLGMAFTPERLVIPSGRYRHKAEQLNLIRNVYDGEEARIRMKNSLLGWWSYYRTLDPQMTDQASINLLRQALEEVLPDDSDYLLSVIGDHPGNHSGSDLMI